MPSGRRPHHRCRSPMVDAAIWSISAGQQSVPARRHVSALAARRIQARSRNDGRSSNMGPTESVRVGIYSSRRPGHSSLRSGTASAATWRQGCDDRRDGDQQNGTCPPSICLRRRETIADRAADTIVGLRQWKFIPSSTAPISDSRQRRAKNSAAKASEIFSAIMIVGRLVLAHGIVGMSEASQI
jgi:hypothetical protein